MSEPIDTSNPGDETVAQATFGIIRNNTAEEVLSVDFNPESLQYTVSNTMGQQPPNNPGTQFVSQSVAKLTMDLIFDATLDGVDVRSKTEKMLSLLKPSGPEKKQVPPRVRFSWGVYRFDGIIEQYKETLDFFSHDGIPLRASINLTLTNDKAEFESRHAGGSAIDSDTLAPTQVPNPGGPADTANALGDPRAARAIASLNGSASLRFDASASLSVSGGVTLAGPAAFASGGAGLSIGGGLGIGAGASIGGGASLDIGATAGAAFTGLRVGVRASSATNIDPQRLLPGPAVSLNANASAGFAPGGMAHGSAGASLATNVGADADLHARISFSD